MASPSDYKTGTVEVAANTYSKPVNPAIGQAIGGVLEMFGKAEQKRKLSSEEQRLTQEREALFSNLTPAQQKIISINEAQVNGRELTKEEIDFQSNSTLLREAVEQGVMKVHQFKRRQEQLLRDAKVARPDLAQEFDRLYADTLGFDVRGAAMDYYNYNLKLTENLALSQEEKEKNALKQESDYIDDVMRNIDMYTKYMTPDQAMKFTTEIALARADLSDGRRPNIDSINRSIGVTSAEQAQADVSFRVGPISPETGERQASGKALLDNQITGFLSSAEIIKQEILNGQWDSNPTAVSQRINNFEIAVNDFERGLSKYTEIPSLRDQIKPYQDQVKYLRENVIKPLREDSSSAKILDRLNATSGILKNSASVTAYANVDTVVSFMKATGVQFDEAQTREGLLEVSGWLNTFTGQGLPYKDWYVPQNRVNKIPAAAFTAVATALTTGKLDNQQKAQILGSMSEIAQAMGTPIKTAADGKEIPRDPNQMMGTQGVIGFTLANKDSMKTAIKGMNPADRHAFALSLLSNLDRYNAARIKSALDANGELPRGMSAGSYASAFLTYGASDINKMKGLKTYTPVSSQFIKYKDALAPTGLFIAYDKKAQDFLSFVIDNIIFGE